MQQRHMHVPLRPCRSNPIVRSARPGAPEAPTAEERRRLESIGGVVTDAAVPEGHKGLHGFLYGEGGAEEHDSRAYRVRHVRSRMLNACMDRTAGADCSTQGCILCIVCAMSAQGLIG